MADIKKIYIYVYLLYFVQVIKKKKIIQLNQALNILLNAVCEFMHHIYLFF